MTDVLKMHLDVGQERKISDQDFLILAVDNPQVSRVLIGYFAFLPNIEVRLQNINQKRGGTPLGNHMNIKRHAQCPNGECPAPVGVSGRFEML